MIRRLNRLFDGDLLKVFKPAQIGNNDPLSRLDPLFDLDIIEIGNPRFHRSAVSFSICADDEYRSGSAPGKNGPVGRAAAGFYTVGDDEQRGFLIGREGRGRRPFAIAEE